jgi:hypothetical protein
MKSVVHKALAAYIECDISVDLESIQARLHKA